MLRWGTVIIVLMLAIILAGARIQNVTVRGNTRYTKEEVIHMLFGGRWGANSFYQFVLDKTKPHKTIPFIQRYDLQWDGPFNVEVIMYEKNIVGYVDYMSSHMYFDKDGIVVESTGTQLEGIPKIMGLSFGSIVLYKELPVRNDKVFNDILNLTGALSEHGIQCDEIEYDDLLNATLRIGKIAVTLGTNANMEMKISTLNDILPKIAGMEGVLDLSPYAENNDHESYIFKEKDIDQKDPVSVQDLADGIKAAAEENHSELPMVPEESGAGEAAAPSESTEGSANTQKEVTGSSGGTEENGNAAPGGENSGTVATSKEN